MVVFPKVDTENRPKPCDGKKRSCGVHRSVNDTFYFKRRETDETFNILKEPLDYSSNHVTYLFECKNAIAIKQKLLNKHLCSEVHQAIQIQSVTLIDQVKKLDSIRKKNYFEK